MLYSGIYRIVCLWTAKVYIGSSQCLQRRFLEHKRDLNNKVHSNPKLQNAWNKYGEELFEFQIIELCHRKNLIDREQYWIDYYSASKLGYNIQQVAYVHPNHFGHKHSTEAKLHWSEIRKGRPSNRKGAVLSEETKEKIRQNSLQQWKRRKEVGDNQQKVVNP